MQNPAADEQHQANRLAEIVWYVAVVDESLARRMIEELPEGHPALYSAGLSYGEFLLNFRGPDAAISRLDEIPGVAREETFRLIVKSWAMQDPVMAMQVSQELDPAWGELMREYAVSAWAQHAPEDSLVWVDAEISGEERYRHIHNIAEQWIALEGPGPLSRWLNTQSNLLGMDPAIQVLALEIMGDDPATALRWAQYISDGDQRAFHEAVIARSWLSVDADTAYAHLRNSPISQRARLLIFGEPAVAVSPAPTVASLAAPLPESIEVEDLPAETDLSDPEVEVFTEDPRELDEFPDENAELPVE